MLKAVQYMARQLRNAKNPHRSGRYVQQLTGYRAFVPAALPPDPPISIAGGLQKLLSNADRMLGRLDGSIQTLPNPDLFVYMYVRKEAVLSSQIEGTQSSLQDLLAAEANLHSADLPRDVDEVVNYVAAMNHGLERLNNEPLSVPLIQAIHAKLLQGVRGQHLTPGELRRSQNWIGAGGCNLNEATFIPPPPHEVPEHLSNLEKFLHCNDDLPLLIKFGIAHAQFETIHPFLDGNGRIGRLLITFLLCEREVLQRPVLYLSYYFKRFRSDYYDRLQAVRDNGDWEHWLEFFLKGVTEVSRQATETARRILSLRESHRTTITEQFGRVAGNGHRVLETLYERPITSVSSIQQLTGVSYQAANDLVIRFVDQQILREITGNQRNRRFRYDAYINLFDDGSTPPGSLL